MYEEKDNPGHTYDDAQQNGDYELVNAELLSKVLDMHLKIQEGLVNDIDLNEWTLTTKPRMKAEYSRIWKYFWRAELPSSFTMRGSTRGTGPISTFHAIAQGLNENSNSHERSPWRAIAIRSSAARRSVRNLDG